MSFQHKPTCVIDNGTGYTKMGFAGNYEPNFIVPSLIGTLSPPRALHCFCACVTRVRLLCHHIVFTYVYALLVLPRQRGAYSSHSHFSATRELILHCVLSLVSPSP
jgi:hypothetical protein